MKLIVDKMPESPEACPFSERSSVGKHGAWAWTCTLRPYIKEAGGKPRCLCKSVEKCDRLTPINAERR